ncbi:MAG: type II CRISPR RNA-guided endonuclease Cas9, partial [Lachnospiraceae bacterium]|nr:type II CRISPR RNA-guided endonuclease Cas9 [Lachnospiraceae bacterium]
MEKRNCFQDYYLGLDIGTNSVGYAVTDLEYKLLKYKGEPMWGSHVFEEGQQASERRGFRTSRRRTNRRNQRVKLISDIFAAEIKKQDENFFIRRKESALFREDTQDNARYIVFNEEEFTDQDYYQKYPTIHHLIQELMRDDAPHDVRLVYLACAYLVAHRGHFLNEVNKDNVSDVLDFNNVYQSFIQCYQELYGTMPWECDADQFKGIMQQKSLITKKEKAFLELLNGGRKYKIEEDEIDRNGLIKLLSGGSLELGKLFPKKEFEEKVSCSFQKGEEEFLLVLGNLDEEGELLVKARNLFDWAALADALQGGTCISDGKVEIYEQHKKDLKYLKNFIRKYRPEKYYEIFRSGNEKANYVAYSYYTKSVKGEVDYKLNKATKEEFSDYIWKKVKNIDVEKTEYEDMCQRLQLYSFLPKQVDGNNRVIPYQLYYYELAQILQNAKKYLPFLSEVDEEGYSNEDKILSVMEFRVPYFVGPLRKDNGEHAWIERKAQGKIYPWNFKEKVDLDKSEQRFIDRMTNQCTYIPGETVLPKYSLLYSKYSVLN